MTTQAAVCCPGSQTGLQMVLTLRAQPLLQSFHAPSAARGREPTKTKGAQAEQRVVKGLGPLTGEKTKTQGGDLPRSQRTKPDCSKASTAGPPANTAQKTWVYPQGHQIKIPPAGGNTEFLQ